MPNGENRTNVLNTLVGLAQQSNHQKQRLYHMFFENKKLNEQQVENNEQRVENKERRTKTRM